ncbi:MAG: cytochrome bc complex cytochrome b subunit [Gaiellaceae bacterium]
MIRALVRYVDDRSGGAPLLRKAIRYVFPDHWSFLLGEVALYSFVVLVGTGVFLTLFFEPSLNDVTYSGSYEPLHGATMSEAYRSVVHMSFDVKAGLLMRQTHHWAADVFVVAIVLHLTRVILTSAYRKPRDGVYYIGVVMLILALLEGYLGYSLVDDLLSGMGLAIGYSVLMSIPFVGANLGQLLWGAPFPGLHAFESRMYIAHVLLLPIAIGVLIGAHLLLLATRHHTQFRDPGRTERRAVGLPMVPGYAPRSLGLACGVTAVLFLLGGLVQINPIWEWGPYEVAQATNGAQPDWYLGWLIGGLRLMPGFDVTVGGYTLVPNPFWGGALFPIVIFAFLYLWPWLERRLGWEGDGYHNLLDRPRDAPARTAVGWALLTWVLLVFVAGGSDRVDVLFDVPYTEQIWVYRVLVIVGPLVAALVAYRSCIELQRGERAEHERRRAEHAARAARSRA